MNRHCKLLLILLVLILTSSECDEKLRFKQPQPEGVSECSEFGKRIQGDYLLSRRNYKPADVLVPEPVQFFDTLAGLVDFKVKFYDSVTFSIAERRIVQKTVKALYVERLPFYQYLKSSLHLIDLNNIMQLVSTDLGSVVMDMDTMYYEYNTLNWVSSQDTFKLYTGENYALIIQNQDTIAELFNSDNLTQAYLHSDGIIYDLVLSDSSLIITEDQRSKFNLRFTDSTFTFREDDTVKAKAWYDDAALHVITRDDTMAFKIINGNLRFEMDQGEYTVFDLSRGDVLRKYKKAYYLNNIRKQNDTITWRVSQLGIKDHMLCYSLINDTCGLHKLSELTDSISSVCIAKRRYYLANPSKKEFKKFVSSDGFAKKSFYKRLD